MTADDGVGGGPAAVWSDAWPGGVALLAAHPDDEIIWFGARLAALGPRCTVIHATDGVPRDPAFWRRAGHASAEAYRQGRRRQMLDAVALAGVTRDRCRALGFTDQEAVNALGPLTREVERLLAELEPAFVFTHPYEGGHPDHDACAAAVAWAVARRAARGAARPVVLEMASYHRWAGALRSFEFLPAGGANGDAEATAGVATVALTDAEKALKRRMYACYRSQPLDSFPIGVERYRRAPAYDFGRAPHPGPLHYETRSERVVRGEGWRALAAAARAELDRAP